MKLLDNKYARVKDLIQWTRCSLGFYAKNNIARIWSGWIPVLDALARDDHGFSLVYSYSCTNSYYTMTCTCILGHFGFGCVGRVG